MSGGGIEAVLEDHYFFALGDGRCVCGEVMNEDRQEIPDWHRAHVAAAVLAWLDARLTEGATSVTAALATEHDVPVYAYDGRMLSLRPVYISGPEAEALAAAALSAVRGVLGGEGS